MVVKIHGYARQGSCQVLTRIVSPFLLMLNLKDFCKTYPRSSEHLFRIHYRNFGCNHAKHRKDLDKKSMKFSQDAVKNLFKVFSNVNDRIFRRN